MRDFRISHYLLYVLSAEVADYYFLRLAAVFLTGVFFATVVALAGSSDFASAF